MTARRHTLAAKLIGISLVVGFSCLFFSQYEILIKERATTNLREPDTGPRQPGTRVGGHSSQCEADRPGTLVSGTETHGRLDLVVEWYCEDISWLRRLSSDLRPHVAIFIADQGQRKCDSAKILAEVVRDLDFPVTHVRFPNKGRDGHATVSFIQRYYHELAEFSFFIQGGFHWYARGIQGARGWRDQALACNSLIPETLELKPPFTPLVMRTEKGPVLAVDAEVEDGTTGKINSSTNVFKFHITSVDLMNRGRELYSIFFGSSPCESGPHPWAPGMQYIVRRDRLTARPCSHWAAVREWLEKCVEYIWVLERVTTPLFNSSLELVPPTQWRTPSFCQGNPEAGRPTPSFWRRQWGCEPLSSHAAKWHAERANSPTATDADRTSSLTTIVHVVPFSRIGNQLFQLAALLAVAELANATPAFSGKIRIAVPNEMKSSSGHPTYRDSITSYFNRYRFLSFDELARKSFVECTIEEKPVIREPAGREFRIGKTSLDSLPGNDWAMEIVRAFEDTQVPIPAIKKPKGCDLFKMKGFFQDRRFFNAVLPRLPELFSHPPSVQAAREELERLVPVSEWNASLSVHYRLTDTAGGWEVADEFYPSAVTLAQQFLKRPLTCVVFADDVAVAWNRSTLLRECTKRVLVSPSVDTATAFYMMSLLPNGIVAASSFSYWASVVGRKSLVIAPDMTYKMFHYLKQHPEWLLIKSHIKGCRTHCKLWNLGERGWPPMSSAMRKPVPGASACEAIGPGTGQSPSCSTCGLFFDGGSANELDTDRWCGWSHSEARCRPATAASLEGKTVLMSCGKSHLKSAKPNL